MDHAQLEHYRQVIEAILSEYASLPYPMQIFNRKSCLTASAIAICGWM
jgi:hypothetical protein